MISVLWDAVLCRSERAQLSLPPVSASFLLGLLFYPEDGDDMVLQNIGSSPNYMALNAEYCILQNIWRSSVCHLKYLINHWLDTQHVSDL
jgi:hypothetical protein